MLIKNIQGGEKIPLKQNSSTCMFLETLQGCFNLIRKISSFIRTLYCQFNK